MPGWKSLLGLPFRADILAVKTCLQEHDGKAATPSLMQHIACQQGGQSGGCMVPSHDYRDCKFQGAGGRLKSTLAVHLAALGYTSRGHDCS